jgi:hypothetical protein
MLKVFWGLLKLYGLDKEKGKKWNANTNIVL